MASHVKYITRSDNKEVKHFVKLRKNKKYRLQSGTCLVMGNKIIPELQKKGVIKKIITTVSMEGDNILLVSEEIMKKITGMSSCEELAAEVFLPPDKNITSEKRLLMLDKIRDPGNMGTLIRTAAALQWDGIIITPDTVDPFNDKALRAAKGSTFSIPLFFYDSYSRLFDLIEEKKYQVMIADIDGTDIKQIKIAPPLILLLSNESRGIDNRLKTIQGFYPTAIPMASNVESLNVAISGAILMYALEEKS